MAQFVYNGKEAGLKDDNLYMNGEISESSRGSHYFIIKEWFKEPLL